MGGLEGSDVTSIVLVRTTRKLLDLTRPDKLQRHPNDPTVVRCVFYRSVLIQEQTGKRSSANSSISQARREHHDRNHREVVQENRTTRTVERDHEQTRRHAEHTHLVYDAATHPWPGEHVPQPAWARNFPTTVPGQFRPFIGVLSGKMARETIVERDVEHKK